MVHTNAHFIVMKSAVVSILLLVISSCSIQYEPSTDATDLAVYMYSFNIKKAGMSFEYATIVEVYHPDYLIQEDLSRIYGTVTIGSVSDPSVEMLLDRLQRYLAHYIWLVGTFTQ